MLNSFSPLQSCSFKEWWLSENNLFLSGWSLIQTSVMPSPVTIAAPPDCTLAKTGGTKGGAVWLLFLLCTVLLLCTGFCLLMTSNDVTVIINYSSMCVLMCTNQEERVSVTISSADMEGLNIFLWSGQAGKVVSSPVFPHTPSLNKSIQPKLNSRLHLSRSVNKDMCPSRQCLTGCWFFAFWLAWN